jgi:hypothetical protein
MTFASFYEVDVIAYNNILELDELTSRNEMSYSKSNQTL